MKRKTKIILKLIDLRYELLFKCENHQVARDIGIKISEIIDLLENSVIVDKNKIGLFTNIKSYRPSINEHRLVGKEVMSTDNEFFNNKYIKDSEYEQVRNLIKEDLLSSLEEEIEDENN